MEDSNPIEYTRYIDKISQEISSSYRKKNRLKLVLRLYSFLGLLFSVLAIIYFAISYYEFDITPSQRLTLMFAAVGLVVSLMSKFYSEIINERENEQKIRVDEINKISHFVLDWATLERTIYSILEKSDQNVSKFGIKRNIQLLFEEQIISDREFINLERALDMRNKIVHGYTPATSDELERYSELLNEVIDKILIWSKRNYKIE